MSSCLTEMEMTGWVNTNCNCINPLASASNRILLRLSLTLDGCYSPLFCSNTYSSILSNVLTRSPNSIWSTRSPGNASSHSFSSDGVPLTNQSKKSACLAHSHRTGLDQQWLINRSRMVSLLSLSSRTRSTYRSFIMTYTYHVDDEEVK